MVGSVTRIFFSWHILWRLAAAFLIPYFLFSIGTTLAADGINELLGEVPPPKVGIVNQQEVPTKLLTMLRAEAELLLVEEEAALMTQVEEDSLDIGLLFTKQAVDESYQGTIKVYYNSMRHAQSIRSVLELINTYENQLVALNLEGIELDRTLINPIQLDKNDTFDRFGLLGEVMNGAKGGISNLFNFLLLLLVLWLARQFVLRTTIYAPERFGRNLVGTILGTTLGMVFVFWGVQVGLDVEQSGMIKSIIISVQRLIVLDQLYPILILWAPTWLFLLGTLGIITTASSTSVGAHGRTFWAVVLLHLVALFSFASASVIKMTLLVIPVVNVFRLGQRNLRGELDWSNWGIAFVATCVWAVAFLLVWWRLHQRSNITTETTVADD
ncbi:MAG: hypothetical protein ACRBFS_20455 [Aureispira sp.]